MKSATYNRNLSPSAPNCPPEKEVLVEKRLKHRGWVGADNQVKEVDRGTNLREGELWIPQLPGMLFPSLLFTLSHRGYNFWIQPKDTVISRSATLAFSLHLEQKSLNRTAWTKQHQCSGCSALQVYTQELRDHAGPQSVSCRVNYSRGKDRKSHTAHSPRQTATPVTLGPAHCPGLNDLHNQMQNPNAGDLSLIII